MPGTVKHRRSTGLPADNAVPAQIQPSNFADSHVFAGAAGDGQVPASATNADGWDWRWLQGADVSVTLTNGTGGPLVLGDVVALSATPGVVALGDTATSLQVYVVCLEASLASAASGRFAVGQVIPTVKNTGAVTAGHYVRKSATTKAVEDTTVAAGPTTQPPAGALGLALSTAVGAGTIAVLWFLRGTPYLPPVTAGYLKGTGTAYNVQTTPIPIADLSTGTPTGAKFLRDDGVLAVPPGGGGGGGSDAVLDRNTSAVTVANTVIQTSVYAFNVLGGTLATNKRLRLTLLGIITDTNAAVTQRSLTLRAKYGATTVATLTLATALTGSDGLCPPSTILIASTGANVGFGVTFDLAALGTAAAQQGLLEVSTPSIVAFAGGVLSIPPGSVQGAAAEDSTADKTLTVTVQWSAANAANTCTVKYAALELL